VISTSRLSAMAAVLMLAVLGCLAWLTYVYVGTNLLASRGFETQRQEIRSGWQRATAPAAPTTEAGPPPPGEAIALLRIPAAGADEEVPVLEGTDGDTLRHGIGHYPGTALPGELGNFAVAAHRVTHGRPFAGLLDLRKGDEVVVETRTAVYTYVLDLPPRTLTVDEAAAWVLDPVPGGTAAEASRALITLTTAQDLLPSRDRSVGIGHLLSTRNK